MVAKEKNHTSNVKGGFIIKTDKNATLSGSQYTIYSAQTKWYLFNTCTYIFWLLGTQLRCKYKICTKHSTVLNTA